MKSIIAMLLLLASVSFAQIVGPKIAVQNPDFSFGDIKQDSFVEHDFVVTNTGGDTLIISDVSASCGCTAAKPEKNILKPGESAKINVKFNTIGRQGHQQKYVYIKSNDKTTPELRLSFNANVIPYNSQQNQAAPVLQFSEMKHDFGVVQEGKITDWTATFKNTGNEVLDIKDIKTSCGCTAAVVSGKHIKPGESGSLRIEFDSTNKNGKLSRTVTITSNDPKQPEQTIVIYAEVKGR